MERRMGKVNSCGKISLTTRETSLMVCLKVLVLTTSKNQIRHMLVCSCKVESRARESSSGETEELTGENSKMERKMERVHLDMQMVICTLVNSRKEK